MFDRTGGREEALRRRIIVEPLINDILVPEIHAFLRFQKRVVYRLDE
jgi:hypothetical protein